MKKITTITDLKNAIEDLEYRQANEWKQLKEQFLDTCDSLKPANIIRGAFQKAISAPDSKVDFAIVVIGLIERLVSGTFLIGKTQNIIKKIIGIIGGTTVSNRTARNVNG